LGHFVTLQNFCTTPTLCCGESNKWFFVTSLEKRTAPAGRPRGVRHRAAVSSLKHFGPTAPQSRPLPDRKGFGYSRPTTGSQTQGEASVVRMRHRLWGGCRCLIRADSGDELF
jgi:hypothetical protein